MFLWLGICENVSVSVSLFVSMFVWLKGNGYHMFPSQIIAESFRIPIENTYSHSHWFLGQSRSMILSTFQATIKQLWTGKQKSGQGEVIAVLEGLNGSEINSWVKTNCVWHWNNCHTIYYCWCLLSLSAPLVSEGTLNTHFFFIRIT